MTCGRLQEGPQNEQLKQTGRCSRNLLAPGETAQRSGWQRLMKEPMRGAQKHARICPGSRADNRAETRKQHPQQIRSGPFLNRNAVLSFSRACSFFGSPQRKHRETRLCKSPPPICILVSAGPEFLSRKVLPSRLWYSTERSNKIRLHPGGSAGCLVSGKTWWSLKRTMLKGKIILRPGQVVRTFAGSGKPYRGGGGNPEGHRRRRYALQRKTSSDPVPAPRGKCRRVRTALLGLEMILA